MLCWLGTLLLAFLPGLLLYLLRKDDPFIHAHAREALNWGITALLIYAIGAILTFVVIGVLITGGVGVIHFAFCLMGAVSANSGRPFRTPFSLRLV